MSLSMSSFTRTSQSRSAADLGQTFGPPATLVLLILVAGISFDNFLGGANLSSVAERSAFVGIIAVGMTYLIISGGIDLAVGSVAALSGVTVARFVESGIHPFAALGLSIAIGAIIGLIQGIAVVRGKLEPFIVTLAGLLSVRGLALLISDEQNIPLPNDGLAKSIGSATLLSVGGYEITVPTLIMLVTFAVGAWVLRRTSFGRSVFAIGDDERSARLLGVKVDRVKLQAYATSGALAALAGGLLAFKLTIGRPFAADAYELQAIGAVVVGGTLLTGGRGTVVGSMFGTLLLVVIQTMINRMGLNAFWQQLVSGLFLLVVVTIQTVLQRKSD